MDFFPAKYVPWFRWLQNTPAGATIRDSPILFPSFMTVHLIGIAMLLGTILMMDLNLLGVAMRRQTAQEIGEQLKGWMLGGLALVLGSGGFLFVARALRCYRNPYFRWKMLLLALALAHHFSLHRRAVSAANGVVRRVAAGVSLALWFGAGLIGNIFTSF